MNVRASGVLDRTSDSSVVTDCIKIETFYSSASGPTERRSPAEPCLVKRRTEHRGIGESFRYEHRENGHGPVEGSHTASSVGSTIPLILHRGLKQAIRTFGHAAGPGVKS